MTNTRSPQKSSESGFALVLVVSIVGLAFVVTVGAFLVAASLAQTTARVSSAKVDIALREDIVMREILQQTAQGMAPGANGAPLSWTAIMTNAVNNVRATTYVDPAEVATLLGANSAIAANMADTGSASLAIFQGYNQEAPFGGTSGLANVLPAYNTTVQPPLMNWASASVLSSATALTSPQEFFLGSLYTSTSSAVTMLSPGKRWGQTTYPNIRFGYKRPGDPFVARRVWWRIPVVYQTTQTTVEAQAGINPYPAATANYVLSIYEIPTELPISANANIQIGQNLDGTLWGDTTKGTGAVQITGSIYGDQVQLDGGTYNADISSRAQVNVVNSATVGGVTFADNTYSNLGVREQRDLSRTIGTGTAPVSVVGDAGKALLVPVMTGNDFFMAAPSNAPTHWDLYARPYYKCRIRILISPASPNVTLDPTLIYSPTRVPQIIGTGPKDSKNDPNAGNISVTVSYLPDTAPTPTPDAVLGIADSAPGWLSKTYSQANINDIAGTWLTQTFMTITSTGTGIAAQDCNILQIDIGKLIAQLGLSAPQVYSIYIGYNPTVPPDAGTPPVLSVAITGCGDLSAFTNGLSIVTKHRLYLIGDFNQKPTPSTAPSTSIYAPDVRYGISGAAPQLAMTGRVSVGLVTPGNTAVVNPLSFNNGANAPISPANNTFILNEATTPPMIPPITRLSLLFTIEKERTN